MCIVLIGTLQPPILDASSNKSPNAHYISIYIYMISKSVPLQAWSGPKDSRKLRFPDFMSTAQNGGNVVSLTHRPHLPPGNTPGTHFC